VCHLRITARFAQSVSMNKQLETAIVKLMGCDVAARVLIGGGNEDSRGAAFNCVS
jgi:hypothetical protein